MIKQCQPSIFNSKSMQAQSIRIHKANKYSQLSDKELFKTSSFIRSTSKEQKNLFTHIRQVGIYSEDRKETFVRFNFRTMENQVDLGTDSPMSNSSTKYGPFGLKALQSKNHFKKEDSYRRGTMNVNELWCNKNLEQVMGFPLFPKDRIKVLNFYKRTNTTDRRQWARKNIR